MVATGLAIVGEYKNIVTAGGFTVVKTAIHGAFATHRAGIIYPDMMGGHISKPECCQTNRLLQTMWFMYTL